VNGPPPPLPHVKVGPQTLPAQHGSPLLPHAPQVLVPRSQTFGALQKLLRQQRSPVPPHGVQSFAPLQRTNGPVQPMPPPQHCWSIAPHAPALQLPFVQVDPSEQVVMQSGAGPAARSQHEPSEQRFPSQQGSPAAPQASQLPVSGLQPMPAAVQ
jgi:hypothetical protein